MTVFAIVLVVWYAVAVLGHCVQAGNPDRSVDKMGAGAIAFAIVVLAFVVFFKVTLLLPKEPSWFAMVLLGWSSFWIVVNFVRIADPGPERSGPLYNAVMAFIFTLLAIGTAYFYLFAPA